MRIDSYWWVITCPRCDANPGHPCTSASGTTSRQSHAIRIDTVRADLIAK